MKVILVWIAVLAIIMIGLPLSINIVSYKPMPSDKEPLSGDSIKVYITAENKVVSMDYEEYILGVLAAEMPASFELEALKAQAVAARTYTAEKTLSAPADSVHQGADVCTDHTHCQAYISTKEAKEKWGKNASLYYEKCKKAVTETKGVIALYNNVPIKAVFHACSSGATENASEVWGGGAEYLKSVQSPGDLSVANYQSEVSVTHDEFIQIMSKEENLDFSSGIAIGNITRTQAGSVKEIEICSKSFKGSRIREIFGLRSACFDIVANPDTVVFKVRGYGHGVGMSQYGANYFAKEGLSYEQILKKYYTGITLGKL